MDKLTTLDRHVGIAPVFRREVRKADGRMLSLYGHQPHTLAIMPETVDAAATGGELRFHPLRQEWNIYAAHRQNRTFKPSAADDPLAPTKAGGPATEIPFADFELAVFDNKFAALHPRAATSSELTGIETQPANGKCEVVVYSPSGSGSLATIGQNRRRLLVSAWLDRYAALFNAGCNFVLPFENRGDAVGVTLHHPHGQIYGFGDIPATQRRAMDAFANGYDLAREIKVSTPDFGVSMAGGVAAFCPRYSRFPYEVWLAPRESRQGLHHSSDEELDGLATLLGEVTQRYDALFGEPMPTMLALHCAPAAGASNYHWTAQFYPLLRGAQRIKYLASVEQHTGIFTVDVMPEAAAKALREISIDG